MNQLDPRNRRAQQAKAAVKKFQQRQAARTGTAAAQSGEIPVTRRFSPRRKLGEGGQGQVWLVADRSYYQGKCVGQKPKAWKFIRRYDDMDNLVREATAVAHFNHENVISADPLMFVPFRDFPEEIQASIRRSSQGREVDWPNFHLPIMCMEYVDGFKFGEAQANDLGKWFDRLKNWKSPYDRRTHFHLMPLHTLWFIISRALRGLEYVNSRGKIHRDIKPGNILINSKGVVKITDFALADIEHFCGTLAYMSPEQMKGEKLDRTTDVYSLGMVAYAGMTGGVPHYLMTPDISRMNLKQRISALYSNARHGYPDVHRRLNDIAHDFTISARGTDIPYGQWLRGELCDLLDDMLSFRPQNRPTPSEAVARLEGIIYKGLNVVGPTNPAMANLGLLYQSGCFDLGEIKPKYLMSLLHLCRNPEATLRKISDGTPLAAEDYPQIARPFIRKMVDGKEVEDTQSVIKEMSDRTQSVQRSEEMDIPVIGDEP